MKLYRQDKVVTSVCCLTTLEPCLVQARVRGGFPVHAQVKAASIPISTVIGLGSDSSLGPTRGEEIQTINKAAFTISCSSIKAQNAQLLTPCAVYIAGGNLLFSKNEANALNSHSSF